MKNIFKAITLAFGVLVMSSCESYLGGGINENPNSPTDAPVSVVLPVALVNAADLTGGFFSRSTSVLTQQTEGVARQWSSINNYSSFNPAYTNTGWNNMYENTLIEFVTVKNKAAELGYSHYEGVADIMIAYCLMMATDVWDDIPYSEALQGTDVLQPGLDTQSEIYTEVFALLNSGSTLLGGSDGGLALGSDDVMYGGDTDKWIKAASALEARGRLHLGQYGAALTAAQNSFASASDNLAYQYPGGDAGAGQWYRFNRDRTGDIEFHPTMEGIMEGLGDTWREPVFDNTFITTHPYLTDDFNQELITYREIKFIEAECIQRTTGNPTSAFLAGIEAHFDHLGVAGYATYVAANYAGTPSLNQIMTEKYIAMFLQPEAYNDWRRTNVPALTPTSGSAVPVRFPYGEDEITFNSNVSDVNIFTSKVGWDN